MKQHPRNRTRANRIQNALKTVKAYDGALDMRATIVDALTDIRHLCDKLDLDLGRIDRQAHQHYLGELNLNTAGWEA